MMVDADLKRTDSGRPKLSNPAILLATWFGAGFLPLAPGTWGSMAALPFAWMIQLYSGWPGLLVASFVVFAVGVWSAGVYVRLDGREDPGAVVIDEVAGQWLVLLPISPDPVLYAVGFFLFRIFDIFKPWPAGWADRNIKGGFGVMIDDILVAPYGAAILYAFSLVWGS